MGCLQSKSDINDVHPNVFRVVNIDDRGAPLWSGQLEVTDSELTLYRRGKEPTTWPLKSLRRYGFDAEIFSFESGRRCATGQGIYAFKCRRAEHLFHTLQDYIQVRVIPSDEIIPSAEYPMPAVSNGPAVAIRNIRPNSRTDAPSNRSSQILYPNGTQQNVSNQSIFLGSHSVNQEPSQIPDDNYLDPVPASRQSQRFSVNLRLNSVGSGPMSPEIVSPSSPGSANILEVTSLNPLPSASSHGVSNLYQMTEFPHRENNNNKKFGFPHSYTNAASLSEFNSNSFQGQPQSLQIDSVVPDAASGDAQIHLLQKHKPPPLNVQACYMNIEPNPPQSPCLSEPYALLDPEAEGCRVYMNVTPGEGTRPSDVATVPSKPQQVARKQVMQNQMYFYKEVEETHNYENLDPSDIKMDPSLISRFTKIDATGTDLPDICTSIPQAAAPSQELSYIVLDLESNKTDAANVGQTSPTPGALLLPPESPRKAAAGYATIDFNKTVALSNSATPCLELDSEGSRKTRHNSTVTTSKHNNSISD